MQTLSFAGRKSPRWPAMACLWGGRGCRVVGTRGDAIRTGRDRRGRGMAGPRGRRFRRVHSAYPPRRRLSAVFPCGSIPPDEVDGEAELVDVLAAVERE